MTSPRIAKTSDLNGLARLLTKSIGTYRWHMQLHTWISILMQSGQSKSDIQVLIDSVVKSLSDDHRSNRQDYAEEVKSQAEGTLDDLKKRLARGGKMPGPESLIEYYGEEEVQRVCNKLHYPYSPLSADGVTEWKTRADYSDAEFAAMVTSDDLILGGILRPSEVIGLIGPPFVGKSMLALILAVSIAAGQTLLREFPVGKPRRVLFLAGEQTYRDVEERLHSILRIFDLTDVRQTITKNLDYSCERLGPLTGFDGRDLGVTPAYGLLKKTCMKHKPDLIIVDTRRAFDATDHNTDVNTRHFFRILEELYKPDTTYLVLHHPPRKDSNHPSGSNAFESTCSRVFLMEKLAAAKRGAQKPDAKGEYLKITMTGENNKSEFPSEGVVLCRDQGRDGSKGTGVLMPLEEVQDGKSTDSYVDILRAVGEYLSKRELKLTVRDIYQGKPGDKVREYVQKQVGRHCTGTVIRKALDWGISQGLVKETLKAGTKRMIVEVMSEQLKTKQEVQS